MGDPDCDAISRAIGDPLDPGVAAVAGRAIVEGSGTPSGKRMSALPPPPSPIWPIRIPTARLSASVAMASATIGRLIGNDHCHSGLHGAVRTARPMTSTHA